MVQLRNKYVAPDGRVFIFVLLPVFVSLWQTISLMILGLMVWQFIYPFLNINFFVNQEFPLSILY
jgi:hypothetical protein